MAAQTSAKAVNDLIPVLLHIVKLGLSNRLVLFPYNQYLIAESYWLRLLTCLLATSWKPWRCREGKLGIQRSPTGCHFLEFSKTASPPKEVGSPLSELIECSELRLHIKYSLETFSSCSVYKYRHALTGHTTNEKF